MLIFIIIGILLSIHMKKWYFIDKQIILLIRRIKSIFMKNYMLYISYYYDRKKNIYYYEN